MGESILKVVLALNLLWFAAGFHLFAIRGHVFAKIVVPREHRDTPVMDTLMTSGKFLGGFNLAFAVLSLMVLLGADLFTKDMQWAILLSAFAVAHGTQFAYNVPVFLQNRRGEGVWPVRGLMRFIFATDFSLTALNGGLVIWYLL